MALRQALAQRDRSGVDGLLGQWTHRHGVDGLEALLQELELEDPDGLSWWRTPQADPLPPALLESESVQQEELSAAPTASSPIAQEPIAQKPLAQEVFKRSVPRRPAAKRPAPAPSHPALAELRAWLPSADDTRAA